MQTPLRTICQCGPVTRSFVQCNGWCGRGSCYMWLWFGSWQGKSEMEPVKKTFTGLSQLLKTNYAKYQAGNNKTISLQTSWQFPQSQTSSAPWDHGASLEEWQTLSAGHCTDRSSQWCCTNHTLNGSRTAKGKGLPRQIRSLAPYLWK